MNSGIEFYLLAAGKGERMGGSKPLLPFGPSTVFERMIGTIRESGLRNIRVIGTKDNADLAKLAFDIGIRYIINLDPELGMAHSIIEAVDDCTSEWLAVCPADMPLITSQTIHDCASDLQGSVTQPFCEGRRKHPVFLRRSLGFELRNHLATGTLREFLQEREVHEVECSPAWQFLDADTPEEYTRLLEMAGYGQN